MLCVCLQNKRALINLMANCHQHMSMTVCSLLIQCTFLSQHSNFFPSYNEINDMKHNRPKVHQVMESALARRIPSACVAGVVRITSKRRLARHVATPTPGNALTTGRPSRSDEAPPEPDAFATCVPCHAALRTAFVRACKPSRPRPSPPKSFIILLQKRSVLSI